MPQKQANANQFVVELGDAEVPAAVARRLNSAIRKAVLGVLVDLDHSGDFIVRFPGRTDGIWIQKAPVALDR